MCTVVCTVYDACVYTLNMQVLCCKHVWNSSREFLRLSVWSASILHFHTVTIAASDLCVARRDVASLSCGQRVLPTRATSSNTIAFSRVVDHHHGGIHA